MKAMEVDLVYLWVNGNDPQWRAKRNATIGRTEDGSAVNCEGAMPTMMNLSSVCGLWRCMLLDPKDFHCDRQSGATVA